MNMLKNFKIKKQLFKNQIHERYLFSINCKGNDYQGIYHDGEISWFNPHPFNDLREKQLERVESSVSTKMQKLLVS